VAPSAAMATASPADNVLNPTSVADLLEPVANPLATLNELQSQRQLEAVDVDDAQVAETVVIRRHHHHHHHHVVIVRHHHHHHFVIHHHHNF